MQLIDNYKHKGLREKLVFELSEQGIQDDNVLNAIKKVPRHLFLDSAFEDFAYEDRAFSILAEQTISRPLTVAFQTQLLQVHQGERILEIGTGSGYQTAILCELKTKVYTIERQKSLFDFSSKRLKQLDYSVAYQTFGDGYLGLPTFAPFDKILVTCGAESLPEKLLNQLKVGGILVIPIGKDEQIMTVYLKTSSSTFEKMEFGNFNFVPMLNKRN
jgi:protein-L-isoaspartate(D-aspartate) O-methyltransferase